MSYSAGGGFAHYLIETSVNSENTSTALSTNAFYAQSQAVTWQTPSVTDDRTDELRGTFEALPQDVVGFSPTTATLDMRLYPNFVGIPLWMALGAPVKTAGDGIITDPDGATIPAGATRWVWDSAALPAAVRSAQMQLGYVDAPVFFKMKGVTCDGMTFTNPETAGVSTMSASLQGTYTSRIADPALTPSYDATTIKPFVRGHHSLPTWLASTGTPVTINYGLSCPVQPLYSFGSASLSPDNWDKVTPPVMTADLIVRQPTAADWDAFVAGTIFGTKSKWVHTQFITGSYPYKLFFECQGTYSASQVDALKHQILHRQTATVQFGKNSSTSAFKITLVNGVSAYSSVG
jgi:hypothetical protein